MKENKCDTQAPSGVHDEWRWSSGLHRPETEKKGNAAAWKLYARIDLSSAKCVNLMMLAIFDDSMCCPTAIPFSYIL